MDLDMAKDSRPKKATPAVVGDTQKSLEVLAGQLQSTGLHGLSDKAIEMHFDDRKEMHKVIKKGIETEAATKKDNNKATSRNMIIIGTVFVIIIIVVAIADTSQMTEVFKLAFTFLAGFVGGQGYGKSQNND